jgi:hypothetical protein
MSRKIAVARSVLRTLAICVVFAGHPWAVILVICIGYFEDAKEWKQAKE